jgi:asparagine synthase (glutamine-hydrolysing)
MCGICGFLLRRPVQVEDQELLNQMNSTIIHRGPDSQGSFVDGNLGMAMRRLAIIDVAG